MRSCRSNGSSRVRISSPASNHGLWSVLLASSQGVVSSPTTALPYVAGMAISELVYSLPALTVLTTLAAVFLHPSFIEAVSLTAVMLLMFLTSVTLGFTLSTFSSDIMQSFATSSLISILFSTLPPVYLPITCIPLPYRYLAYLSPTTYAAGIAHNATGFLQLYPAALLLDWAVLIGVTSFLALIAAKKARWREV